MGNIIEATVNTLKTLVDTEEKPPLHVGEVIACWTYLAKLNEADTYEQITLNTTTDDDLREAMRGALKMCKSQIQRMQDFMTREGVPLPTMSETMPVSDPDSIHLGAKLTDDQLANGLSIKVAAAAIECGTAMAESIRTDVGLLFGQFLAEQITFGTTLKTLMRKRGWLKGPPYYYPPGLSK